MVLSTVFGEDPGCYLYVRGGKVDVGISPGELKLGLAPPLF